MKITTLDSLAAVDAADWNRLVTSGNPFLEYGFLNALERAGCLDADSGWTPQIVVAHDDDDRLIGAVPLYLKDHSAGEFVFDWGWAEAAMRAGISYYPKAVAAVPFSPVTGARILVADDDDDKKATKTALIEATLDLADQWELSSVHFNFIPEQHQSLYRDLGLPIRQGMQYHWKNGAPQGDRYADFDDFLSRFRSKKRSNIRRERRKLAAQNVTTQVLVGESITDDHLRRIFRYYLDTVQKHVYGRQYLNEEFFLTLGQTLRERLHIVFALQDETIFAGAFNLRDDRRLYGRYWGCEKDVDYAHFETCMYRPIEYCIEHDLDCFEPGAGGDHKYDRGFLPTPTYSAHYIRDPRLRRAVKEFVVQERQHIDGVIAEMTDNSPFKSSP